MKLDNTKIFKMKATFYPTKNEQEVIMQLVYNEQVKRRQSTDNYNVQEVAFRQAISDGAMRTDNYFKI